MLNRIFISAVFFSSVTILEAQAQRLEESVFIYDSSGSLIQDYLGNSKFVVDHKSSQGFEVYGPRGLKDSLKARGLKFRDLDRDNFILGRLANPYPSFEQLQADLKILNNRYRNISRMFSIGKTVEGRDLWFMEISKHIGDAQPLPEVKYISSMHGDEITGRELMMRLIRDILEGYEKDREITRLVDNTRIFIMPSMNPDGSYHIQRWNGNRRDLNRNFPDFSTEDNQNSLEGREPETQAIMKFQQGRHIALSANFHGGAEVVNYMWDTIPDDHPLLPLLKDISLNYANGVSYMRASQEFPNGITNGFAWYEVNGGMQDWSYYWYNDLQFTIELSGVKYPDYNLMDQYYRENKDSLLGFLSRVHQGVGLYSTHRGVNGSVRIIAAATKDSPESVIGDFKLADSYFYKVLMPGHYRLIIDTGAPNLRVLETEVKAGHIVDGGNIIDIDGY